MNIAAATRLRALVARYRFLRFLLSGGINTFTTYAIYLALLRVIDYRVAYTIAYLVGILLAYALNRLFVFRTHRGWSSVLLFPLVYISQYLASLATIWIWVEKMGLTEAFAPLAAIVITIPLTYVLSQVIFVQRTTIRRNL